MNKIITLSILGIFLIGVVVAQGLILTKEQKKEIQYKALNIMNDFTNRVLEISTSELCVKDGLKLVKNSKCEEGKAKYSLVNLSDSKYFYENSQGVIKFENE